MPMPPRSTSQIQDPFFYQLRKDERMVHVYLTNGKRLAGILRRFDRFAIVLEHQGQEQIVFKHAIASISAVPPSEIRS